MNKGDLLTRSECAILKAIAIVMIMTHNFSHLIEGIVPENEFSFTVDRGKELLVHLAHPDYNILLHLLSFFGHYGVPLFLFLSGYGLVMKYERSEHAAPGFFRFVGQHSVKLLKLMFLGFVCYMIIRYSMQVNHTLAMGKVNILAQFAMVINFLSEPWLRIKPGPYWFFGLMLQLYVIYRAVLYAPSDSKARRWVWPVVFILVCWVMQIWGANPHHHRWLGWMRYNFFVAALPFALGLLVARYQVSFTLKRWQWCLGWLAAWAVVLGMNFSFHLWLWAPAMVVVSVVSLAKALPRWTHTPLVWTGGISAMLFVVHPLVRTVLIDHAKDGYIYSLILLYLVVSFVLAIAYKWLLKRIKI